VFESREFCLQTEELTLRLEEVLQGHHRDHVHLSPQSMTVYCWSYHSDKYCEEQALSGEEAAIAAVVESQTATAHSAAASVVAAAALQKAADSDLMTTGPGVGVLS